MELVLKNAMLHLPFMTFSIIFAQMIAPVKHLTKTNIIVDALKEQLNQMKMEFVIYQKIIKLKNYY